jgi:glutathione S-transferase
MDVIVKALSSAPYLLGDRFSAADVLYGTTFAMFAQNKMLPPSDIVTDYARRVVGRPAFARAQTLDAPAPG